MTIGERVLALIHKKGMTQIDFSIKTGIPQSTMSSWKGKGLNPSIDKLKTICDTLDVDPYYLISGTNVKSQLNQDYLTVYRKDEEYYVLVEYRKLDTNNRIRLRGYIDALMEMQSDDECG